MMRNFLKGRDVYKRQLLEVVAEADDALMERYFENEGADFTVEELSLIHIFSPPPNFSTDSMLFPLYAA